MESLRARTPRPSAVIVGTATPTGAARINFAETALNAGFNEGSKEGRNDRSHNRYRNYSEFSAYNDATKDYSSRLGDRDLYQRYYQAAFESGYDTENPGGRNNRNNQLVIGIATTIGIVTIETIKLDNGAGDATGISMASLAGRIELRQTALNAGYNAGAKEGRNDRKRNRSRSYSGVQFLSRRDN